jgi:hypothetical protein
MLKNYLRPAFPISSGSTTLTAGDRRKESFFTKKVSVDEIVGWLNGLDAKVQTFKWSKTIPSTELFNNFHIVYWAARGDIALDDVMKLNALFKGLDSSEHDNFAKVIQTMFSKVEKIEEAADSDFDPKTYEDDIPF